MNRSGWLRLPFLGPWALHRQDRLCRRTAEHIQEIVDGELPLSRARRRLERHAGACTRCGASAESIRQLKAAIARVGGSSDPVVRERLVGLLGDLRAGRAPAADVDPGS